jgi:hypothetical protein
MKIACVCIAKNEDNYIQEWAEYNIKLGFDQIVLYQNNWRTKFCHPKLTKIEFDESRGDRQIFCYNKFIQDFKSNFNFAAFFDIDEFLVLKKHKNIKSFMENYEDQASVCFNWFYFGDNGFKKVENNDYRVLKRFTKRGTSPDIIGKSIVKIDATPAPLMAVHKPYCSCLEINTDIAQLNHYYCKTREEFEIKKNNRVDDHELSDHCFNLGNNNEIEDKLAYNLYRKIY